MRGSRSPALLLPPTLLIPEARLRVRLNDRRLRTAALLTSPCVAATPIACRDALRRTLGGRPLVAAGPDGVGGVGLVDRHSDVARTLRGDVMDP